MSLVVVLFWLIIVPVLGGLGLWCLYLHHRIVVLSDLVMDEAIRIREHELELRHRHRADA